MATFTARPSFAGSNLRPAAAQPISRPRVVKTMAMQVKADRPIAGYFAAAAAAAALLISSPAMAGPSLPSATTAKAELAGAGSKAKQAAQDVGDALPSGRKAKQAAQEVKDSLPSARKGALAPDVEGQRRAGTGRAAGVANMKRKWVAASKEDQASAAAKYPTTKVNWRRGVE